MQQPPNVEEKDTVFTQALNLSSDDATDDTLQTILEIKNEDIK